MVRVAQLYYNQVDGFVVATLGGRGKEVSSLPQFPPRVAAMAEFTLPAGHPANVTNVTPVEL
jgi:hypothetical protein